MKRRTPTSSYIREKRARCRAERRCSSTRTFGSPLRFAFAREPKQKRLTFTSRKKKKKQGEGDRGLEALLARLKAGKHSCENLLNMFVSRADMEEEYARKLSKLSKEEFGKEEEG